MSDSATSEVQFLGTDDPSRFNFTYRDSTAEISVQTHEGGTVTIAVNPRTEDDVIYLDADQVDELIAALKSEPLESTLENDGAMDVLSSLLSSIFSGTAL